MSLVSEASVSAEAYDDRRHDWRSEVLALAQLRLTEVLICDASVRCPEKTIM